MRLANDFKDQKCARCFQPMHHGSTIDAVYENGEWYHRRCLEEGKRQFAEAQKQSHLAEDSPLPHREDRQSNKAVPILPQSR